MQNVSENVVQPKIVQNHQNSEAYMIANKAQSSVKNQDGIKGNDVPEENETVMTA